MRITLCIVALLVLLTTSGAVISKEINPKVATGVMCVIKRRAITKTKLFESESFVVCENLTSFGQRIGGEFYVVLEAYSEASIKILESITDKEGRKERTWIIAQYIGTYKTTSGLVVPVCLIKQRYKNPRVD